MKGDQKKVVSNEQKPTLSPSKHQREGYQRFFQSTNVGRDPPRGLWPIRRPQIEPKLQCIAWQNGGRAGGGVTKSKRNQPNTTQTSKQRQPSSFQPKKSSRDSPVWENLRLWQIFKNLCSRLLNICPNFAFKRNFEASMILKHSQEISQNEPACSEDSKNGAGNVNPTSIGRVRPERRRQIRPGWPPNFDLSEAEKASVS